MLTLANRAVYRGDSKYPSLWDSSALILAPPLGNTGATLYDMSGNARHATHNGTWVDSAYGPRVRLAHGSQQAITGTLTAGDVPADGRMSLVMVLDNITVQASSVIASKGAYETNGWYLQMQSGALAIVTATAGAGVTTFASALGTGRKVVILEFTIPTVRLWVNGVITSNVPGSNHTQPVAASATPLYIGRYSAATAGFFTTLDCEFAAVYNRTLSAAEIRQITADCLSGLRRQDD